MGGLNRRGQERRRLRGINIIWKRERGSEGGEREERSRGLGEWKGREDGRNEKTYLLLLDD